MNLYKITFSHHAPKGSDEGIKGYLLANSDKEVYDFIINSKDEKGFSNFYACWEDKDSELEDEESEDGPLYEINDEKWNVIASFNKYEDYILHIKGDINDENFDFSDSYYGISRYGWELVAEDISAQAISLLKDFKIVYNN